MNKKTFTIVAMALCVGLSDTKAQIVHEAIDELRAYCATSYYGDIEYVKEWGFSPKSYLAAPFTNAVASVSNHWQDAIIDWGYYATNSERRLILANIVSFAGTNAFIGIWSNLVTFCENTHDSVVLKFIDDIHAPATGPLEDYVFLHFDIPAISNCLLRTKALYSPTNIEMQVYFNEIFSGYRKELVEERNELDNSR